MQTILQKMLQESRHAPNINLEHVLFVRLQKRIERAMKIRFISYCLIGIFSSISLVWYAYTLYGDLNNSGTYSYFRLFIEEDLATLSLVSKEILYAIVESLPIMSITLSLGFLFMVMVSINGILLSLQRRNMYTTTN